MYGAHEENPQGADGAHGDLVASIARFLRPDLYIEIGCNTGETFEKVEPYCAKSVAVDIQEARYENLYARGLAEHFVCKDSLEYIPTLTDESVDLCFIDSSHDEETTVKEFRLITPKMAKNGVVLFHDGYPPNKEYEDPGRCGGVSRAIERLRKESAFFEFATLPCQFGLTIARKSFGKQVLWR